MDDILASIRKILNEDEQGAATIMPAPAAPHAVPPAAIQLTPEMMIAPPESLAGPVAAVPAPVTAPTPVPAPAPVPEPLLGAAPPPSQPEPFLMSLEPQAPPTGLVDPTAAAAAASAFGQLSRLAQDRGATVTRNGPSIEELVREELRPMLKAWLDAHLPATVERLVRAEIERVMSRQG
jgi:hypothetical protein